MQARGAQGLAPVEVGAVEVGAGAGKAPKVPRVRKVLLVLATRAVAQLSLRKA